MKVLKFGGTSMGSDASIRKVQRIIEQTAASTPLIVVVSAVSGVTDRLTKAAQLAKVGDPYETLLDELDNTHRQLIKSLLTPVQQMAVTKDYEGIWQELTQVLKGVSLTRELSTKSYDTIVATGERISALLLSARLGNAQLFDSRRFISTEANGRGHQVQLTNTLQALGELRFSLGHVNVFPGFIAGNEQGETTTLGRGGSDYSAALLAAGVGAGQLEIWTDVDGFMSADPRLIKRAYCIDHLSYAEAMELSHFGAKVIYPPTILPALQKKIPIRVKNTFQPASPGTLIDEHRDAQKTVKGLSSIREVALLTLQGSGMIGVTGISMRLFSALAAADINIILISQASSENSISVVLDQGDAETARLALIRTFEKEIARGAINGVTVEKDMAVVAIVGEGMKRSAGVSGRLFDSLGRNGINIYAIAQGASELNISFVIRDADLRKSLNVVHEAFFLSSYQAIHLYLVGVGVVGKSLLQKIERQAQRLLKTEHLSIRLAGLANSRGMVFSERGLPLNQALDRLQVAPAGTMNQFVDQIITNNYSNSVFVDCTASAAVAGHYQRLLENNVSVVTANKIAGASAYEHYANLKKTARNKGVKYLFETNVGAGLPIINTINSLVQSGDRILQLEGVLSGTLNYILNNVSAQNPLSKVVKEAMGKGYSEPDPRIDLSGTDVVRKLLILARESEYALEEEHIETTSFIPSDLFREESVSDFLRRLEDYDMIFEQQRSAAEAKGKVLRYVAALKGGQARVGFVEVDVEHPLYQLADSNNKVLLRSDYYYDHPMEIKGYGAGADVTAAGVFADIIKVLNL
ncbi:MULTISPECIES: bifunctional aspartate kinase/homoserine dehydrogenase I [unclassified Carboxylicivirga]|uniref:bifunctional aspartate kinase/homoserine dehydrogenase I n=1 Tax=Carboxylicivirga TaxID=1628153 RepID=UPI003D33EEDD